MNLLAKKYVLTNYYSFSNYYVKAIYNKKMKFGRVCLFKDATKYNIIQVMFYYLVLKFFVKTHLKGLKIKNSNVLREIESILSDDDLPF